MISRKPCITTVIVVISSIISITDTQYLQCFITYLLRKDSRNGCMKLNISHKLETMMFFSLENESSQKQHTHLFLSSESTTTCLFFCGGGGDSRAWRTADTFSRVVNLVTVEVTEWVSSGGWGAVTADES